MDKDLSKLTRRSLLLRGTALGALLSVGPMGGAFAAGGPVRFGIFGSANKLKIRGEAVAKYAELHPDASVVFEGVPSDAWPDKIAAMVAGGNAPDVITLGSEDLIQYSSRGALATLDEYAGGLLNTDNYEPTVLDLGRIDGKLYALPIAVSIQGIGYNETILERLGMGAPPTDWTMDDYAAFCAEIHKADSSIYGSHDHGGKLGDFQMSVIGQGGSLLNDGGTLEVSADQVAAWFDYWAKMRASGGAVPADMQAQFTGTEWPNAPLSRGSAVFASMQSQDIASGYQALTEDKLNLTLPPRISGDNRGLYPQPTSSLTLNAKSQVKEETVKLMDWFVSDPESAKVLGLVSGPPASRPALEAVMQLPDLSEIDGKVLRYSQAALPLGNSSPGPIRGQRAVNDLMRRMNENVGFGTATPQEAANEFIAEANTLLTQ